MLAIEVSNETKERLYESDNTVKLILPVLENNKSVGKRLVEAFGTDDKEFIAKILGFKTVGGLYKVLSGEREMDFVKLKIFRNHTKRTIDWLLTGELDNSSNTLPEIDKDLLDKLKAIANEQARVVYADLEIAGENVRDATLRLLAEYLLDDALLSHNLIAKPLVKKPSLKRAQKFTFVANREKSIEARFRQIVIDEIERLQKGDDEEDVTIEPADLILAPVITHVGDDEGGKLRKTG